MLDGFHQIRPGDCFDAINVYQGQIRTIITSLHHHLHHPFIPTHPPLGGRGERQIKGNLNGTSSHHVTFFALQSTAGEASYCSGQKHDSFSENPAGVSPIHFPSMTES